MEERVTAKTFEAAGGGSGPGPEFPVWRLPREERGAPRFFAKPEPAGPDLAGRIAACPGVPGGLNLFWLGQAGFVLRSDKRLVLIDPYLSDVLAEKYRESLFTHRRLMPPPLPPAAALNADFLLATHGHSDHMDPGLIGPFMRSNPRCRLVCPAGARKQALERGAPPDRLEIAEPGGRGAYDGIAIEAIPSAHETIAYNERGEHLYLGYVVEMAGLRIYHSGDCAPYEGLAAELARRRIDVALLPVNGRDEFRASHGVAGNFTIHEAARLCLAAGIGFIVPHHFGMFDFNTVGVDEIRQRLDGCLGLEYWLPSAGAMLTLRSIDRGDSRRFSL